jgi:hypothetical protein
LHRPTDLRFTREAAIIGFAPIAARRAVAFRSTSEPREVAVSVFMILRVKGDPDALEQYANANADLMRSIADAGKAAGATRHAFAAGDGEVLVIDEWSDAESFQRFFESQKDIPRVMQAAGAEGAPQIAIYRKLSTPDEF